MSVEALGAYRETIDESEFAQVDDDDVEAVRVYVSGGGCGGMTYGMTFTDRKTRFDKVLTHDGLSLYVDAVALNYLKGPTQMFRAKSLFLLLNGFAPISENSRVL